MPPFLLRTNQKILGSLFILAILVGGAIVLQAQPKDKTKTAAVGNQNTVPRRCAEEQKLCPDGSVVPRVLPSCDFTACSEADPAFALTKDWKEYTDTGNKYAIKFPPTWAAKVNKENVTISSTDQPALTIARVVDDSPYYVLSGYTSMTIDGKTVTQADDITPQGTTRMIWMPRDDAFLVLSWKQTGKDATYYQMLTTLRWLP